jgi:hypothetical protein
MTPPNATVGVHRCDAASFNHLIRVADSEVVILLESGAVPGPGAIDRLVAALRADPRSGIAGPSTNGASNQQCCVPAAGLDDVEATAAILARAFGKEVRVMEPPGTLEALRGGREQLPQSPRHPPQVRRPTQRRHHAEPDWNSPHASGARGGGDPVLARRSAYLAANRGELVGPRSGVA